MLFNMLYFVGLPFGQVKQNNNLLEAKSACLGQALISNPLDVLKRKSWSAEAICFSMKSLVDEYDTWKNAKMIISDSTALNADYKNEVVIWLQT